MDLFLKTRTPVLKITFKAQSSIWLCHNTGEIGPLSEKGGIFLRGRFIYIAFSTVILSSDSA
jgi:hypothetical protein